MFYEGSSGRADPAHDHAIQAMHRIAGRYRIYGDDKPFLALWTPKSREMFLKRIMDLHDQIVDKYFEALQNNHGAPFTPGGEVFEFVEPEYSHTIKMTKPQVNKAVVHRGHDGNRMDMFTCPAREAWNLCRDVDALKQKIIDNFPDVSPYKECIVQGRIVWDEELEDSTGWSDEMRADADRLREALSKPVPRMVQACRVAAYRLLALDRQIPGFLEKKRNPKIQGAGMDTSDKVWYSSFIDRPGRKSGKPGDDGEFQHDWNTLAAFFLRVSESTKSIVAMQAIWENVKTQAELHANDERSWDNREEKGCKILSYWYPADRNGNDMVCALDFPQGHPFMDARRIMLTSNHFDK